MVARGSQQMRVGIEVVASSGRHKDKLGQRAAALKGVINDAPRCVRVMHHFRLGEFRMHFWRFAVGTLRTRSPRISATTRNRHPITVRVSPRSGQPFPSELRNIGVSGPDRLRYRSLYYLSAATPADT